MILLPRNLTKRLSVNIYLLLSAFYFQSKISKIKKYFLLSYFRLFDAGILIFMNGISDFLSQSLSSRCFVQKLSSFTIYNCHFLRIKGFKMQIPKSSGCKLNMFNSSGGECIIGPKVFRLMDHFSIWLTDQGSEWTFLTKSKFCRF